MILKHLKISLASLELVTKLQNLEDFETHLANSSFLLPEVLAPHLGLPKRQKHTLNITEATGESL
jgi:hypothetical protein